MSDMVVAMRRTNLTGNKSSTMDSRRTEFDRRMAALSQTPDLIEPTQERRQQTTVERDDKQTPDADGGIGRPFRAVSTLKLMERNGMIGEAMVKAGEEFQQDFGLAAIDTIRAADLSRAPGGGAPSEPTWRHMAARERVWKALCALGGISSPAGCCAWHVLGVGTGLHAWAVREGWNNRPISEKAAGGILIGALGVLQDHYNY